MTQIEYNIGMKVRELQKLLSECDPNGEVIGSDAKQDPFDIVSVREGDKFGLENLRTWPHTEGPLKDLYVSAVISFRPVEVTIRK